MRFIKVFLSFNVLLLSHFVYAEFKESAYIQISQESHGKIHSLYYANCYKSNKDTFCRMNLLTITNPTTEVGCQISLFSTFENKKMAVSGNNYIITINNDSAYCKYETTYILSSSEMFKKIVYSRDLPKECAKKDTTESLKSVNNATFKDIPIKCKELDIFMH